MASRGRLCIFMTLVAAVLAAPAASMADAPRTGSRRHHHAPAPAPAGRSSAMAPSVPRSKAPAPHVPVSTPAPSPKAGSPRAFPHQGLAKALSSNSLPGDGATIPSSGATPPGTGSSTQQVVTAMIAPSAPSSIAVPAMPSTWTAAFSSVAGVVALMLL